MAKIILPQARWESLLQQLKNQVPEAFDGTGDILNLIEGKWQQTGNKKMFTSSVDGTILGHYPMLNAKNGNNAVEYARADFNQWSKVSLDDRKIKVQAVIDEMEQQKELLAYMLVWEIGKPYDQALNGVERCISGVQWYIDDIENMLGDRKPLGLISNIASWNYPISVLVHACLVQVLSGNSIIAKTPTDGGLFALTLCFGIAHKHGLPFSLISGSGGILSESLVLHEAVDCLSYVGGKSNGRMIASSLFDKEKRYMLEMEGVNTYGVWNFSDWETMKKQIKAGFGYGKQRCTAYVRFVVQRTLLPQFLEIYLPVLKSLTYGHPLLVEEGTSELPKYDFGPLINSKKVSDLNVIFNDAISKGAAAIYQGTLNEDLFLPHQDISAYYPPTSLLNLPKNAMLYHSEPFGPLDSIVLVDSQEELISEMNVSNGSLVTSIACDDPKEAKNIAQQLRGYKVGINTLKSRGDNEATFGGIGESWKGCFVGGEHLVKAVTIGEPNEKLAGNFPEYTLLPEIR
ncbi:MAG: acyl-CoA reductase-like NAD-dependent aldehyde dehydrogenase [Flavobacteriales bacterium]|jgi:acyl-CoA reductase-like NAD-dependent aldehyde dehydrogenase